MKKTEKPEKFLSAVLIITGDDDLEYTDLIDSSAEKLQILAVADPIKSRRDNIRDKYNIPERLCFENWQSLLNLGKIADLAFIVQTDKQHLAAVLSAIYLHFDLIIKKSDDFTADEKRTIRNAVEKNNVRLIDEI